MEIKDILDSLGLDFSNPETRRGALEAIGAILASRAPMNMNGSSNMPNMGGNETEVELDPDLLQPSIKQAPQVDPDDIEIEDEEHILDQIKHKESDEPIENTNSAGQEASSKQGSDSDTETDQTNSSSDSSDEADTDAKEPNADTTKGSKANSDEDDETSDESSEEDESSTNNEEATEDSENESEIGNDSTNGETEDTDSSVSDNEEYSEGASDKDTESETDPEPDEVNSEEDDFDFDEDDLLDDELKASTEDEEIKAKHDARKIKRERTLAAAKKALADAQAKKVAPALIRELEKAIEALEALTEAVTKNIRDISDDEFNLLINRVFDAIQACGDSGLTFTSDEERAAQVKEIKNDISSAVTQAELSAEDAAQIRAETQAVKAREKETDKYRVKSGAAFKGFQDFLNSLYRAIALQVHTEETRDDSWSALSRRNSGAGVLRQGQKINELPNKKIPVIDFYFDQSGSWNASDIKVGEKAVQCLADLEADGKIKINIYYFADSVHTDAESARNEGGTSGWNEIVKNIITTQATNVIIMTDADMENWWYPSNQPALKYTVPGYVWYLWKRGKNAPRLPRDLRGRGGTQQFSFNRNDA